MTRKRFSLALFGLIVCGVGAYAAHWTVEELRYRALVADRALSAGDRDASIKRERECPDPAETLVFIAFGQSNAANHGAARLSAPTDQADFYDGRCFSGDDPQFLATSMGGSPWPAFGWALRAGGETRPILFATIAVGNTRIDQWRANGEHGPKLSETAAALEDRGYDITAALFFQGESDRETPEEVYLDGLRDISRALGATPLVLSNSSICGLDHAPVAALARARTALAQNDPSVIIGPNTDALGPEYRSDGCHFNAEGLKVLGEIWADRVRPLLRP